LQNCGDSQVKRTRVLLQALRKDRNQADYDLQRSVSQIIARQLHQDAQTVIRLLDAARTGRNRATITDAIRVYERDVLLDVTWQGP